MILPLKKGVGWGLRGFRFTTEHLKVTASREGEVGSGCLALTQRLDSILAGTMSFPGAGDGVFGESLAFLHAEDGPALTADGDQVHKL